MTTKVTQARRRNIFAFVRLIHIYSSTLLFGLVVFFCVSGITLNHRWYGDTSDIRLEEHVLNDPTLDTWGVGASPNWLPDLTQIGAFIRAKYGFPQAHSVDINHDMKEVSFDYKVPAGFANVTIISTEKMMIVEVEHGSSLGILNDLHKGRHVGQVWFWLIDISAALMSLFALTGMIIVFQGKKNRRAGVAFAFVGLVTPVVIFLIFVPSIGV